MYTIRKLNCIRHLSINQKLTNNISTRFNVHLQNQLEKGNKLSKKNKSERSPLFSFEKLVKPRNFSSKMNKPAVYVTRSDFSENAVDLLRSECEVSLWTGDKLIPREELTKNITGKSAIFCSLSDCIDKKVLDQAGDELKVISTCSVGYEHIDVAECKRRGIKIGYTPGVLTDATAELTVALLLATSRRLVEAHKQALNGGWTTWAPNWMCGPGLKDSVVGIVGFGRIGQEVARRIKPFRPAKIIYSNRSVRMKEAAEIVAQHVEFEELLTTSDFIIITVALTDDTKFLINSRTLEKMKSTAILINTARGGIINQDDLIHALQNGKIRAAGLDVTTPEPLPLDNPLLTMPNCVILPHIGSADIETRKEMAIITAKNIINALKGEQMISEV